MNFKAALKRNKLLVKALAKRLKKFLRWSAASLRLKTLLNCLEHAPVCRSVCQHQACLPQLLTVAHPPAIIAMSPKKAVAEKPQVSTLTSF